MINQRLFQFNLINFSSTARSSSQFQYLTETKTGFLGSCVHVMLIRGTTLLNRTQKIYSKQGSTTK